MLVVNLKDCKPVRCETRFREFCGIGKVILRVLFGIKGGFESSVRYEGSF